MALATALVGCSDDGLNPQNDTSGTGAASAATGAGDDDQEAGSQGGSSGVTASGGSATGGADSAGTEGADDTAGPAMPSPCAVDLDCQLVNDCCACGAVHVDEVVSCDEPPCFAPLCQGKYGGVPTPVCEGGACTIEFECNEMFVVCDAAAPSCPEGTLPLISEGCYTGSCVPAGDCNVVPDCTWCSAEEACVANETQLGTSFSCETLAPECGGVASCACLPNACDPKMEVCADTEAGVTCSCPTC